MMEPSCTVVDLARQDDRLRTEVAMFAFFRRQVRKLGAAAQISPKSRAVRCRSAQPCGGTCKSVFARIFAPTGLSSGTAKL